ncbi:MAG TPA: ABC transporter permease subunit [Polyangiaceae bacterium]|nr:ABC transporter permease subunit [Polyangiaceae bacterium]
MIFRVLAITLNTYREAVRARLLLGVFALGLATCLYAVIVASLSLHNEVRVVADLGSASLSLYAVVVAIVIGSTSLYRELEHKTIFPILSRPIHRWEYLIGKYAGIVLTIAVFAAVQASAVLALLAVESGQPPLRVVAVFAGLVALLAVMIVRARTTRVFVLVPWAAALPLAGWLLAPLAPEERRLVVASAVLAVCEGGIVAAVATLFSSFSSPALTATFTGMVFVIGRSADTLAHLPKKLFGDAVGAGGRVLARIFPNLHVYVPARSLLLGQVPEHPVWRYVGAAALHAVLYVALMLGIAVLAFRKRDFS